MKPRRHVILFQSRFADLVESGVKPHTIRPERKRPIHVGDTLDLRAWSGLPYRSKQRKLRIAVCLTVREIEVNKLKGLISLEGDLLTRMKADMLALSDGFRDRGDMADWFENMHGLPFKGVLIEWA